MRKLFLLSLIIFACNRSTSSNVATVEDLADLPASAKKEPYSDNPDLVRVTIEASTGIPLEQGNYLNGKKYGTWTTYHSNELIKSITTYINGVKEGTHVEINDRGQITLKAHYHNGQYDGDYLAYKNIKVVERRFYKVGKLEGTLKKYYDNGDIMEESIYENGKLNGIAKWYDQAGKVTLEYEYRYGQLINK